VDKGTLAGRYELQEPIGSGWRARDLELDRDVLVRPAPEATAGALLDHPNVARVFDQGEEDGERYVVLEYLPGGSLEERLPGLDEQQAYAVAAGVAAALAHAHERGVVHGSLSASRIFLDEEGRAKVAGFAGAGDPADDVEAAGQILIRLAAAAPALGPIAAAALAGELDAAALLEQIRAPAPVAPGAPVPEVEETTLIERPPASRRRLAPFALAAALALLAAGVAAALLLTSDGSTPAATSGSLSVPVPSSATAETTPSAPPETTTGQSTESTTAPTTTAPTTTAPPETTTAATTEPETEPPPLPTDELPTTEPLPTEPPTTEPLPTEPVTTNVEIP
jgi:serine/threonine protein kinase